MDRNHRGDMTKVYYPAAFDRRYDQGQPECTEPHRPPAGPSREDRRHRAVMALILGLVSLGFWPLGPIAAWYGLGSCAPRHNLRHHYLWMALTGTLAGSLATFGLAVWLVARVTLHLV